MITVTPTQAAQFRSNPASPRTPTCPLCDQNVKVQGGISLPHVCNGCGNVWQPARPVRHARHVVMHRRLT